MFRAVIIGIFGLFVVLALWLVYLQATGQILKPPPPSLSGRAAGLRKFMSRERVIELLGPADWLIREADKGKKHTWGGILRGDEYELVWKNQPCTPVIVVFSPNGGAVSWDEGRTCEEGISDAMSPPVQFSCAAPDRAVLCR